MFKRILVFAIAFVIPMIIASQAFADPYKPITSTYLPDPLTPVPGSGQCTVYDPSFSGGSFTYDCTVASTHDDFISFSADLMAHMDPNDPYNQFLPVLMAQKMILSVMALQNKILLFLIL